MAVSQFHDGRGATCRQRGMANRFEQAVARVARRIVDHRLNQVGTMARVAAGGERRAVPSAESTRVRSIAWLPDSRHIVVVDETTTLVGSRIVLEDLHSAARRLVLTTVDDIEAVATTPDGDRACLRRRPGRTGHRRVLRGRAVRPGRRRLVDARRFSLRGRTRATVSFTAPADQAGSTASGRPRRMVRRRRSFNGWHRTSSHNRRSRRMADGWPTLTAPVFTWCRCRGDVRFGCLRTRPRVRPCAGRLTANGSGTRTTPARLGRVPSGGGESAIHQRIRRTPGDVFSRRTMASSTESDRLRADVRRRQGRSRQWLVLDEYATRTDNRGEMSGQFSGDGKRFY